jgi:23S rRNA (cytosine1962-C5)-methyltransferase
MNISPDRPVIRLLPKSDPRRIKRGFPWAYSNELVLDRRTKGLTPGAIATLEDKDRLPLATVAVNPASKITVRVLDGDPAALIDEGWLAARITTALAHRDRLFDAPFYRLIHAEADGLPGVIIDRFGDVAVIQPNAAWADVLFDALVAALQSVTGVTTVVKNASGRARTLEGLDDASSVVTGTLDGLIEVPMNGATYLADLLEGQKTGLFFDQRPNHAFAARLAKDARVLDVFSHVGGFGLAALAGGAANALAVDGSEAALALAAQGATATGVSDRFDTRKGDAFKVMEMLAREDRAFDLVICDPPAFAPNRAAFDAGLRAYERVARLGAALVAPGGYLVVCSCSHAVDLEKFRAAALRGIGARASQLVHTGFAGADHPMHPALAESGYLKAVFFRLA